MGTRAAAPRPAATCGREFGAARIALGLSVLSVAQPLGIHTATLQAWERDLEPLAAERRAKWEQALRSAAQTRVRALARAGWKRGELPDVGLRSTLQRLKVG